MPACRHLFSLALLVPILAGCTVERREPGSSDRLSDPPAAPGEAVTIAFRVPADSEIPAGPLGASIRRGRAILEATGDSLPGYVGNALRCTTCHLDAGTRPYAAPWVGVYSRFPQYRSRNAKINLMTDRVNDCIQRSLAGKPLAWDSREMGDIVAYMGFLSRDVPVWANVEGQGFDRAEPLTPDTARGRTVYQAECARCHGQSGDGTELATPLWGDRSYTIGAGMARVRTAAAFIRRNMPFDRPNTLTNQQAFDVAGYINSRPRPDFAPKEFDWPLGDPPPDVAYPTRAARARPATEGRSP